MKKRTRPDLVEYNKKRAKSPEWELVKKKIGKANKGKRKGIKFSEEHKQKIAESKKGAKNPNWKGKDVGYYTLHAWLTTTYGSPPACEHCGKEGKKLANGRWNIDWASKDNKTYTRDKDDYFGLCRRCHFKHDNSLGSREFIKTAHLTRERDSSGKFI